MMKVRLDFCDFWPGFNKTNNYFYNLLRERFEIELCDQPDFILYADPGQHMHRVHNCVKIYYSVESFEPDFSECDYAFTCRHLDDPRHLRLPWYVPMSNERSLQKTEEEIELALKNKTGFCSFVVSNAGKRKTQKRIDFFHKLSKYKKVDSGGRALNNIGGQLAPGQGAKLKFLRQYKFNIAFENSSIPGYLTEKLTEAMSARTIPIYWGDPRVAEEFNPKSFLNYFDFAGDDALIEKIIELDQDDAKYAEYMRQPWFHNNQPNIYYNHERLLDQFEKIFTDKITPVSRKRYWNQIGRWIPVKKGRPAWV